MNNGLRKGLTLAAITTLIGASTACSTTPLNSQIARTGLNITQGNSLGALNSRRIRNGKKWTIAIHLAADNNLYSAGLKDINEMEAGLASDDIDVVVLFDGIKRGDSKIYRIKRDPQGMNRNIISEVLNDKGAVINPKTKEIDSGDPKVFHNFVDWVTKNFPAEHNSIAIWNHGSGIYRAGVNVVPRTPGDFFETMGANALVRGVSSKSFASDDNGGEMHLKDLNPALSNGAKNLGKPFDILGFDTCLMGYMETAYQVKGLANVLVASEELEPGDGWDYQAYIAGLSKNPDANAHQLSALMVDAFGKSYRPGGSQRGRDITLSAIDINQLTSQLVPAVNRLGAELKNSLGTDKAVIDTARNATQSFYNRNSADLGDFVGKMSQSRNGRVSAAAVGVQQAMNSAVINETHYGGGVERASGIQLYFPRSNMSYNRRYDDASDILFAENPAWGQFLKAYTGR